MVLSAGVRYPSWRDLSLGPLLMYWCNGEGLLEDVASDDLHHFLEATPERLSELLLQRVRDGYFKHDPGGERRFWLSARIASARRMLWFYYHRPDHTALIIRIAVEHAVVDEGARCAKGHTLRVTWFQISRIE